MQGLTTGFLFCPTAYSFGYHPASQMALITTPITCHFSFPPYMNFFFYPSLLLFHLKKTGRDHASSCSCCTPPPLISWKPCLHLLLGFHLSEPKEPQSSVRNTSVSGSRAVKSTYVRLADGDPWPPLFHATYGANWQPAPNQLYTVVWLLRILDHLNR